MAAKAATTLKRAAPLATEFARAPLLAPVAEGETDVDEAVEVPEADEEAELDPVPVALVHETLDEMVAVLLKVTSAH